MSQLSAVPAGNEASTRDREQPNPLSFTLIVVSPSVGVSSPLTFASLPATTTVRQLKAKIRDSTPSKPSNDRQRLIYRGRLLGREAETMLEVFGQETLGNSESQTIHLVLRDVDDPTPPSQANPIAPAQGMQAQQPRPSPQQAQQYHQVLHQAEQYHNIMTQRLLQLQHETQRLQREMGAIEQRHRAAQAAVTDGIANGEHAAPIAHPLPVPQAFSANLPFGYRPPQAIPPAVQNLIAQQQRDRAAEGRVGVQDATGNRATSPTQTASGRASPSVRRPDHTTTYTREGIGPNGERWHMTVNETTTTLPIPQPHLHSTGHHQHPPLNPGPDIQAVLRNADRYLSAQNNMMGSASNPEASTFTQAGPSNIGPAAALPGMPGSSTTPLTTNGSPSASTIVNPPTQAITQGSSTNVTSTSTEPTVYLVSSPQGPRALLVSNSETFFTPRQHSRRHRMDFAATNQEQAQVGETFGLPEYRNRPADRPRRNRRVQIDQAEQINGGHANPPQGVIGVRVWQAVWTLIRFIGMLWLFSGHSSWTRWFLIGGVSFIIFLFNVGALNGTALNELFRPIIRYFENRLPMAGPEAALVPAVNAAIPQPEAAPILPAGNEQTPTTTDGEPEPDPAQAAERLVRQHREANGGWVMSQVRRVEHALLLFFASLVPGVGERHIAHREAEANAAEAERQRRIAAAEAIAAAAENPEGTEEVTRAEGENTGENQQGPENQPQGEQAPAAPVPLIEV
ncbi:hypothetical protein LHYA1_G001380 [Lachnellula hyalina]|uniref:Ubiquitin-like domain-containing protein n=1 Tax=Lachnellula hyalina TaxID=1316788 RepID=A0A8H8R851_9HELO|nr:uncharacterized protein LHYA1_G001380 [Lachnellula hyalina]TVY29362.1 hypothetical protein LHYA1_G001380 [Lachnellula hyalina]